MAVGAELVPSHSDLIDIGPANFEEVLTMLRERGASEALYAAANEADLLKLYHMRAQNQAAANGFARLKVLAEAAMGRIDTERTPNGRTMLRQAPLVISDNVIAHSTRLNWRLFAVAQVRGLLESHLDEMLDAAVDLITSTRVAQQLRDKGVAWVSLRELREVTDQSGLTRSELAKRTPKHANQIWAALEPRANGHYERVNYWTAAWVAELVSVDPRRFAVCPGGSSETRALAISRARMARRALREAEREQAIKRAVRRQGGALAELYANVERMQDVLGQAHREATDTEVRVALSLAGQHYRSMRDQVVRALGVA